jgi:hypothetical protein
MNTPNPIPAPDIAVEAVIRQLMALVDGHGAQRWNTGTYEQSRENRLARMADKAAVAARMQIEAALHAALARPQEVAGVTDEQADEIANACYRDLLPTGYNGGMGGQTWDRALVRAALAASRAPVAVGVEPATSAAKHWHDLYRAECQKRQDDAARFGAEIQALELEAPSAGAGGSVGAEPASQPVLLVTRHPPGYLNEGTVRLEDAAPTHEIGFMLNPPPASVPLGGEPNQASVLIAMLAEGLPMDSLESHLYAAEDQINRLRAAHPLQAQDAAPVEPIGPAFDVSKITESDKFGGTTYSIKVHFHERVHAEKASYLLKNERLSPGPYPQQAADQADSIDREKLELALVWYGCSTPTREMMGWFVGREVNRLLDRVLAAKAEFRAPPAGVQGDAARCDGCAMPEKCAGMKDCLREVL